MSEGAKSSIAITVNMRKMCIEKMSRASVGNMDGRGTNIQWPDVTQVDFNDE